LYALQRNAMELNSKPWMEMGRIHDLLQWTFCQCQPRKMGLC
jgi:hypothetical protein